MSGGVKCVTCRVIIWCEWDGMVWGMVMCAVFAWGCVVLLGMECGRVGVV